MAQKPPKGRSAGPVATEAIEAKVGIDMRDVEARLQGRYVELLADGKQRGLVGDSLWEYVKAGLEALSDAPIALAGRAATSEAMSLGRNVAAQELGVGLAVRTAILDDRTCDPCIDLDGAIAKVNGEVVSISAAGAARMTREGFPPASDNAYFALMPPNFCNGEDLCRCLLYYRRAA